MAFRVSSSPDGVEVEGGKRGPGRPRKSDALRWPLQIRHSDEQHRDMEERAKAAGLSLVDYARTVLWPPRPTP